MRHICMTPSNTLSSTDASKFALKIIEQPIIRDYLSETHGLPLLLVAQIPNEEDWWDTVSKDSYANILSKRHKGKPSYSALLADKYLRWPDLSTFNGPSLTSLVRRGILKPPPIDSGKRRSGRSEIYEIKPNNPKGKKDALDKLFDVEESYKKYGISGIYGRGITYPFSFKKTIYFETPYLDLYKYLIEFFLKPLGIRVSAVSIEVNRIDSGVLVYKFCVDLEGADSYARDSAWVIANFVVRTLLRVQTMHEKKEVIDAALIFADTIEPDDPAIDPKKVEWVIAGRDFRKTPYLTLKIIKMASELDATISGIRDAMYSRLIGSPGDRFFVCSDEDWYQTNIASAGKQKVAAQISMLRVGSGLPTAKGASFIYLAIPMLMSADTAISQIPLVGPAYRWVMDNLTVVLIVVVCSIVVTAALIAAIGSGGSAAPISLPVAGAALAEAGSTIGGGAMAAPIMATAVGADAALVSAGSTTAVVEGGGGGATGLLNWARQAAQLGATESELAKATAESAADEILIKILSDPVTKAALETAIKAAKTAVPIVGAAVIGLSASPVYAYSGPPSGQINVENMSKMIQVKIGNLYLIRVPKGLPTQIPAVPELYKKFNADDYVLLPNEKKGKQELYMLGCVEVT